MSRRGKEDGFVLHASRRRQEGTGSCQQDWQVLEVEVKVTYDQEVDVLMVVFSGAKVQESDEDKPGVILDYDQDGNVVGLEILNASKRVENPRAVEYAVAG